MVCSLESGDVYTVRIKDENHVYALKLINITSGHRDFGRKFYLGNYAQSLVDELQVIWSIAQFSNCSLCKRYRIVTSNFSHISLSRYRRMCWINWILRYTCTERLFRANVHVCSWVSEWLIKLIWMAFFWNIFSQVELTLKDIVLWITFNCVWGANSEKNIKFGQSIWIGLGDIPNLFIFFWL